MKKSIRKSVSLLLAVIMAFSVFTIVPFTAGAVTPVDTLDLTSHYIDVFYESQAFNTDHFSVVPADTERVVGDDSGWIFDGDNPSTSLATVSALNGETITKIVLYKKTYYYNTPVLTANGNVIPYTQSGNVFTFENVNASSFTLHANENYTGNNFYIQIPKIEVYYTAAVPGKTLQVGTEYYIGDTFKTNGSKYIIPDNRYMNSTDNYDVNAAVQTPTYSSSSNYWYFPDMIRSGWGFGMVDKYFNGTENIAGFKCAGGDGLSSNTAFSFDLIYENETDSREMDFSDVQASGVSIQDASGDPVSLTDGKAEIKTDYTITSTKPLLFPHTSVQQQTDDSKYVYLIKKMVQSDEKVAYDTSAFKGKITSYDRGSYSVQVQGYEGTSPDSFYRNLRSGGSVDVDLSHGTTIIGQDEYYQQYDKFFDIYNSAGENITDQFTFSSKMSSNGYYYYYYYKLKQSLEDDIFVFGTGTEFKLTLPEGVTIANADDIVTAQDGNTYTTLPAAKAILVSDKLLTATSSQGYLSLLGNEFKKVINGKYVYEITVSEALTVNETTIITTQEEFNNAKTGDIIMPVEPLDVYTAGYTSIDYREYFRPDGNYYQGSGSGSSVSSEAEYSYTILPSLSITRNGTHEAYPVNVGKHENDEDYTLEEDKGNAWLITRSYVSQDYGYYASLELEGFNLELADYQFTWAADDRTATVSFDNAAPIDADMSRVEEPDNQQWVYSASSDYKNVTYIETRNVNKFTVKWVDADGTPIETDENVLYGTAPEYNADEPEKDEFTIAYTFTGWTDGKNTYASDALPNVTDDVTYTAVYESERKPIVAGHSITLEGDIGVNFYLRLTEEEAAETEVSFAWNGSSIEEAELIYDSTTGFYKATCPVAVAEMTCPITATITVEGQDQATTDIYSVRDYADVILSEDYRNSYKGRGARSYENLENLVKTMLDYGAKAQNKFKVNTDKLANEGIDYTMQPITASAIPSQMDNFQKANLAQYGLKYYGTSIVFLSKSTLRHYFQVTNADKFNEIKDSITFDEKDATAPKQAKIGEKSGLVYFDMVNISADNIGTPYALTIGNTSLKYAVLDYLRTMIASKSFSKTDKDLATATYWYNQAANTFFQYAVN